MDSFHKYFHLHCAAKSTPKPIKEEIVQQFSVAGVSKKILIASDRWLLDCHFLLVFKYKINRCRVLLLVRSNAWCIQMHAALMLAWLAVQKFGLHCSALYRFSTAWSTTNANRAEWRQFILLYILVYSTSLSSYCLDPIFICFSLFCFILFNFISFWFCLSCAGV